MFSRLPRLFPALVVVALGALLLATGSPAQQPPAPAQPSAAELKAKQEENAKLFKDFTESLVKLANRLEKSDRPEDKEKAKTITKAIELASKENVSRQFDELIKGLARGKSEFDLSKVAQDEVQLRTMLKQILDILLTDDESAMRKEEIRRLEAILKQVKEVERQQKVVQAITESKSGDPKKIANNQNDLADRTKGIVDQTGDKKPGDKAGNTPGGDKKDDRAEAKPEAKPGENAGEGKGETGEAKGEGKEAGMGQGQEGKDGKEGGDGKGAGEGMGKEGKGGEGKGPGDSKEGMGKEGQGGEGKGAGDPKAGPGSNPMDPKNPMNPTTGNGEAKPGQGKPGEGKGEGQGKGEGKPGDSKAGGEGKGSGQGKGEGQGQGQGKGEGQGQGQGQGQGEGQGQGQPNQKQTPGRKELEEAVPHQQQAGKKVGDDNRKDAGKDQEKALDKIAQAIQELEKRLKQLREEETKKLLAALENRINKMLVMQIEVYEATKSIDSGIKKANGEIGPADRQKSLQQGDREGEIVAEADKAMKLMENEGSAVAFATVLSEVRQDMLSVQRRLGQVYVDSQTQLIEKQIIDMLKDMAEALKKAQQEPQKPQEGKPGEPQKPANKKLLDLIAELKLIRSLQKQVNDRTKMYGDQEKAEQSKDPVIQAELRMLSTKQTKLQEMLDKIATKGDD